MTVVLSIFTIISFQAGSGRIKLLEQEVSLLKEVQHENIIELFSVYETGSVLFMVFEYCESELGQNRGMYHPFAILTIQEVI